MTIVATKFIRKPLYVDAVRVTDSNFDEIATWCQGEVVPSDETSDKKYIKVRVHNPKNARQTKAFVGDWLLYTERGYKVYTHKAFLASFDDVNTVERPIAGKSVRDLVAELRAKEAEAEEMGNGTTLKIVVEPAT